MARPSHACQSEPSPEDTSSVTYEPDQQRVFWHTICPLVAMFLVTLVPLTGALIGQSLRRLTAEGSG